MTSNYLYILISILIIFYIYLEIDHRITVYNFGSFGDTSRILVEINSDIISADIDNIINHLSILKDNLITLHKLDCPIDNIYMTQMHNVINLCETDLNNFKSVNNYNDYDDSVLKSNVLTYNNLYKTPIDLINSEYNEHSEYTVLNTIVNIEIAIGLLQNSTSGSFPRGSFPRGILRLTNVHNLIKLSKEIFKGNVYLSYDEIFNDSDNTYTSLYTNDYGVANNYKVSAKVRTMINSQSVNQGIDNKYVNDHKTPLTEKNMTNTVMPRNEYNSASNTQWLNDSNLTKVIKRNCIDNYVPFCNITKILENKRIANLQLVDSTSRQSLRNDYNF